MPVTLIVIFSATVLLAAMTIGYYEWRCYLKNVRTVYRCTGMVKQTSGNYAQKDYGPFATKEAASSFSSEFNDKFGGFLVVDSVRRTRENKKEFKKVYEKTKNS